MDISYLSNRHIQMGVELKEKAAGLPAWFQCCSAYIVYSVGGLMMMVTSAPKRSGN